MWNTLVFCANEIFTGSDGNSLQENFTALAQGQAGAPALNVNSFIVSGVGSINQLEINSGLNVNNVASISNVNIGSGDIVADVGSFNEMVVNSSIQAEVGCFRNVDVASNLTINGLNWPHFALRYAAGTTPEIIRQLNVSCLERLSAGRYIAHVVSPAFTNSEYFLMSMGSSARHPDFIVASSTLDRIHFDNISDVDATASDTASSTCILGFGN